MPKRITTENDRQAGRVVAYPVINYMKEIDGGRYFYQTRTKKIDHGTGITITVWIERYTAALFGSWFPRTVAEITYSAQTRKINMA